jgi:hypothetical protein
VSGLAPLAKPRTRQNFGWFRRQNWRLHQPSAITGSTIERRARTTFGRQYGRHSPHPVLCLLSPVALRLTMSRRRGLTLIEISVPHRDHRGIDRAISAGRPDDSGSRGVNSRRQQPQANRHRFTRQSRPQRGAPRPPSRNRFSWDSYWSKTTWSAGWLPSRRWASGRPCARSCCECGYRQSGTLGRTLRQLGLLSHFSWGFP